ncbi:hypothetical protein BVC93_28155 [Mycobacterium sp. MS1601]|uniref:hypothetical protein n=1 Tax=Mycobacterium sp. MS1601 TaxID=1936029 RepID=UPI00097947D8|nr:hypothetical protein [Mycobacterium sp. MS1601]AQA05607.1 hypothetical protein BVC93_28155 [Mycobacterium sp. MS1601]
MAAPFITRQPGQVVRVADHSPAGVPGHKDIVALSAPLSDVFSAEFDGAVEGLGIAADALLLAALGRAVERTLGAGFVAVDIADGKFAGATVSLRCASARDTDANEMLLETESILGLSGVQAAPGLAGAEVSLSPTGVAPVEITETRALQLCVSRRDELVQLDWWYDLRRFNSFTVEELAEQYVLALVELSSEAAAPLHS